jgi:hypothetical protein
MKNDRQNARQNACPAFDSYGCVDRCNHYLTRLDCCILCD